jgi:hypothetical protein
MAAEKKNWKDKNFALLRQNLCQSSEKKESSGDSGGVANDKNGGRIRPSSV